MERRLSKSICLFLTFHPQSYRNPFFTCGEMGALRRQDRYSAVKRMGTLNGVKGSWPPLGLLAIRQSRRIVRISLPNGRLSTK